MLLRRASSATGLSRARSRILRRSRPASCPPSLRPPPRLEGTRTRQRRRPQEAQGRRGRRRRATSSTQRRPHPRPRLQERPPPPPPRATTTLRTARAWLQGCRRPQQRTDVGRGAASDEERAGESRLMPTTVDALEPLPELPALPDFSNDGVLPPSSSFGSAI